MKDRVERIYSLDGPGFPEAVVNSFEYSSVSGRIVKIVPDSSVVGMVLETPERCMVVKSDVEGIMQHFAFSWQMHGGEFDKVEDVANSSVTFNKALNKWLVQPVQGTARTCCGRAVRGAGGVRSRQHLRHDGGRTEGHPRNARHVCWVEHRRIDAT